MEEKSRAVVLHLQRCAGDKMVVCLYTEKRGILSFVAKTSRSRRSLLVQTSLLRVLNILEITYDYRPQCSLQQFGEVRVAVPFVTLPYDPIKGTLALYLSEVLYYVLRNETGNEPLFRYLCYGLSWLDASERGVANFHLVFLMRLTRFLGFWPAVEEWFPGAYFDLQSCRFTVEQPPGGIGMNPQEAALLPLMLRMNFGSMHLFQLNREQRQRFADVVMQYYRLHLPNIPEVKSARVLHEVLS